MLKKRPVVTFVTRILPHYRVPFHERVNKLLINGGVDYRLIHGQPDAEESAKGDLASLHWAETVANRALLGRSKLVWQPILKQAVASDLLILGQENQLLVNYPLQLMPARWRPMIALWGHGRNFQSRNPGGAAERWKLHWAKRCDWWFAYTEASQEHIQSLGFPHERITVLNNAIDTTALRKCADALDEAEIDAIKRGLGIAGSYIAVFVGGLYPDKRLDFLIAAAERVRARVPGFTLVVIGGGVDQPKLAAAAVDRPWLIAAGPLFGREKAALMRAACLFLMPGLVGLAVLDAATVGLPIVTTAYPYHSPEIAYIEDGVTGMIVADWENVDAYAEAVAGLMLDTRLRERMAAAAWTISSRYTIEAMADRFCVGILDALAAGRRTHGQLSREGAAGR